VHLPAIQHFTGSAAIISGIVVVFGSIYAVGAGVFCSGIDGEGEGVVLLRRNI